VMTDTRFRTGAGRLCLDLVRTLRRRGQPDAVEELPDADTVVAWTRQVGPATAGPIMEQADLAERTRTLREAIYELLVSARAGEPAPEHARAVVNEAARPAVPAPQLWADGGLVWTADDPVQAALALVARDALELATSSAVARVRRCADPSCGALFVDSSRTASRRWCSMDVCGNRAKRAAMRGRR